MLSANLMAAELTWTSVGMLFLAVVALVGLRYVLIAGGGLLLVTLFEKALASKRIQARPFTRAQLMREAMASCSTVFIFAAAVVGLVLLHREFGLSQVYRDVDQHGWLWFAASIPIAILIHDFYFYWTHRFMHLPGVFEQVHRVHHLSTNPSPLAAFAFHPIEAVIEAGVLFVIALVMPIHVGALAIVMLYMIVTNVMGHLGYELLPGNLATSRWFGWINTATSHNLHHQKFNGNFGLYTMIWDRLFGTVHPTYETRYSEVTGYKPEHF
jgi:Delta7-sterol 5-desaturase